MNHGDVSRADCSDVTDTEDGATRGARIRERYEALGISDRKWHKITGIGRVTLNKAMNNDPTVRPGSYDAIEANLDKLEAKKEGRPVAMRTAGEEPHMIEFDVSGDFGVRVVVKGPIEDAAELEETVARLIRKIRTSEE